MKRLIIVILLMIGLLNLTLLLADQGSVLNSKAFSINSNAGQTELNFKLPDFKVTQVNQENLSFSKIESEDAHFTINEGLPELPFYTVTIAIPQNSTPTLLSSKVNFSSALENIKILPAQAINAEDKSFKYNSDFYSKNTQYPENSITISSIQTIRDFNIVSINVYPFVYNPATKTLVVNKDIKLIIGHNSKSSEATYQLSNTISREFEPLYRSLIANYDQIRADYQVYSQPHILIIHPASTDANFISSLNSLVNWKRQKGFKVTVASTTQTGTGTTAIKAYIQSLYNNPNERPDYVTLIGDHSGTFTIPTYILSYAGGCPEGAGDSPYSFLAGDDYLGDVMIGRMSISSVTEFQTMVNKVLLYEKNPTMVGTDWLKNNVLVGDPSSSGHSCISMMKYIKETVADYEPASTFTEIYSSPFPTPMQNAASQGALFFAYRGYISMSGFSESNVSALTNDKKLFAALFITCNTGSFNNSAMTETITRVGTPSAPKGAIIAVGMSTSHTLTPYNNFMIGSMIHGHFVDSIPSAGGFTLFGRINTIQTYNDDLLNHSKTVTHWMNLMGDPSVNIYRAIPKTFLVQHDATLQIGQNYLTVVVKDNDNNPVKNAWVSLADNNYVNIGFMVTDESGVINIPTPASITGNVYLTVSSPDFKPYIVILTQDNAAIVGIDNHTILDSPNGNNNQQVNPGETITYSVTIKNNTASAVNNVNLILRSNNPLINISDSVATINSISAGSTANATDAFIFSVSPVYPNNMPLNFSLIASTGSQTWTSMIFEQVKAIDLDITSINVVNATQMIELGVPANIHFTVKNNGSMPAQNLTALLKSKSLFLQVSDSTAVFDNINEGLSANNSGDTFTVTALSGIFPGVKLKAEITFSNTAGYSETEEVMIQVGTVTTHDPVPPDPYGYVIYDITDSTYSDAPEYNWTEISTIGTQLSLTDSGDDGDSTIDVNVPFSFKMYGQSYNQLSVCSNGWASAVLTDQTDFRPLSLPNAVAPRAIIAPYMADLAITGAAHVYTYYDQENHAFIIQWNKLRLVSVYSSVLNDTVTFQAIIYDPAYLATAIGDSPLKFQYKQFEIGCANNNLEKPNNYFTCGIQDHTAQRGLTYCFSNTYSPGAAPLGNHTALFITHPFFLNEAPYLMNSSSILHDQNGNNTIEAGEMVNVGFPLVNVGLMPATNVQATLSTNDPYITVTTPQAQYNNITPSSTGSNINYFCFQVLPSCPNDHNVNMNVHITSDQADWNRSFNFVVKKPSLAYRSYLINDTNGNSNGILEAGETVKLVLNILNSSLLPIYNVTTNIVSANPNITITDASSTTKVMQSNTNYQNIFELTLSPDVTTQTSIPLQVNVTSDNAPTLTFELMLGVNQSGALLQENFNNGLPQGWIIQYNSSNWSSSQTNEAGGTAPEIKFSGTPNFNGLTRLVSQTMDATDISSVVLSYHQKINVLSPGTTIGVATRSQYSAWHVVWSETINASVPSQIKNIPINNSDLGRQNLQICWFVDGNSANIQNWFIDDVTVQTDVGNTALINGNVNIDDVNYDLTKITVKAGDYATSPDTTGSYHLYLIPGLYSYITAATPFAIGNTINNTELAAGQVVNDLNFNMNYLMNPRNLTCSMNSENHTATLNWSYQLPQNSPLIFSAFKVFRQINSGNFELVNSTNLNSFSETLQTDSRYRYYVITQYATGTSDSSNVIYVNPNVTPEGDLNTTPIKFALNQNYPNPFNPTTNIAFSIPDNSNVRLNIYNIKGQLVKTLKNERMLKGNHTIQWNGVNQYGKSVGSGIYFIKLDTDKNHSVKKALLLK